jgi:hypothetical protein
MFYVMPESPEWANVCFAEGGPNPLSTGGYRSHQQFAAAIYGQ